MTKKTWKFDDFKCFQQSDSPYLFYVTCLWNHKLVNVCWPSRSRWRSNRNLLTVACNCSILVIIDRDTISVYFVFVTVILYYYRPRYYLGLFCFCYCYTLLLFIYLFIIPSNRDPLPHCISKTNNNITIKFLVHTQQCLTTCRPKNSVTFTDDLDPWPWPYHKCAFWAISQYLLDRTSPNFYTC